MSYVIQNFNDFNKRLLATPRFKYLLILSNLEKFIFFFKFLSYNYLIKKTNLFKFNYFAMFLKYFFSKQYLKLIDKADFSLVDNYLNNVIKSSIFMIFSTLENFLLKKKVKFKFIYFEKHFICNSYFYSIKTTNFKINTKLSENIFLFFLSFISFI